MIESMTAFDLKNIIRDALFDSKRYHLQNQINNEAVAIVKRQEGKLKQAQDYLNDANRENLEVEKIDFILVNDVLDLIQDEFQDFTFYKKQSS